MITTIAAPLAGRVALVTGASRGIGAAIAVDLARKGCSHIAITYSSNIEAANEVISKIQEISSDIGVALIKADVTSVTFGPQTIKAAVDALAVDHLDIVISNAALSDLRSLQPIESHTKEAFDQFMTANIWSPLQLSLAAIPHLRQGGRIIIISSVASKRPNVDPLVILGATKAAMDSIARSLAVKYPRVHGITINSVAVGPTNTDAMRKGIEKLPKEWSEELYARASAGRRIAELDDVVGVVS
ncbi:hypothetical protein F5884DRAFT_897685 [Xylogone sp. PMI_703]|nr:hypothetical protein F5884DRAFT_897685 [Xylogone sp. PMI_703]